VIPRNRLSRQLRCPDAHQGRVFPREAPLTQLIHDSILGFYHRLPFLPKAQASDVVPPVVDLVATGLRRLGQGDVESTDTAIGGAQISRMRSYMTDNLMNQALGVHDLCQRFGVSRSYIDKLFRPMGGIAAYIRERRLQLARRTLASGRTSIGSIGDVAFRCGFSSHAQFSRVFRERFDTTPRETVRYGLADQAPRRFLDGELDRSYEGWIRSRG